MENAESNKSEKGNYKAKENFHAIVKDMCKSSNIQHVVTLLLSKTQYTNSISAYYKAFSNSIISYQSKINCSTIFITAESPTASAFEKSSNLSESTSRTKNTSPFLSKAGKTISDLEADEHAI